MSHKLHAIFFLILMVATAFVHGHALWQQRKKDDFRSNNINFSANHLDFSQFIPNIPDFTQIQNTLTVNEKLGMAYAAFINSSSLHFLQVNLTNGIYSIRKVDETNAKALAVGAVLDEYAFIVLTGTEYETTMIKIALQEDHRTFGVYLPQYGQPYTISYSANPESVIVVSSRLVGSFQKSALNYEYWSIEMRNSNFRVSSLLVPDESGDVLYVLTSQYLERISVNDGNKIDSIGIETNVGDLPTLSLASTYLDDVFYNVEVSCEDSMKRVYNIFTTTGMKKGSDEILSQKIIPVLSNNSILGMTKIMRSETTFISKNIKLGYTIMDRNGKGISTISSNVIAKNCEILTSSNNRFYAFCCNGLNLTIESKKLP